MYLSSVFLPTVKTMQSVLHLVNRYFFETFLPLLRTKILCYLTLVTNVELAYIYLQFTNIT